MNCRKKNIYLSTQLSILFRKQSSQHETLPRIKINIDVPTQTWKLSVSFVKK